MTHPIKKALFNINVPPSHSIRCSAAKYIVISFPTQFSDLEIERSLADSEKLVNYPSQGIMKGRTAANRELILQAVFLAALILFFPVGPLYSQSDSISGLAVSADGNPMAGIPVKAIPDGTNSAGLPTITTKTDVSGRYLLEGVPYGTYTIHAEPDGGSGTTLRASIITTLRALLSDFGVDPATGNRTPPPLHPTIIPMVRGPARVTVPDNATTGFDLLVLPSAFVVAGQLVVPEPVTLPQLKASLTSRVTKQIAPNSFSTSQFTVDTDVHPDGKFEISNVPPGTYVLRITPNLGISPQSITVTDHKQTGVELGGRGSGVRVSGDVPRTDRKPYEDAYPQWVYLVGKEATEADSTSQTFFPQSSLTPTQDSRQFEPPPPLIFADEGGTTIEAPIAPVGPDGRFEFLSVPRGAYYLRTYPEMGIPNSPLSVGDVEVKDVHAGIGVRVRGEVISLNAGRQPPELIRLTANGYKGGVLSSEVKVDGSFEFAKVGPGTYQILLDNKIRPKPSEIMIGEEDLIFRVEAAFRSSVTGRVVFAGAIPPAEILAELRVGMNNGYDSEVKPDGSFQIKSDEGEYEFFLKNLPEEFIVKSITDGIANLMIEPVKVDLSSPPREILVTLEYKSVLVK
jgi:hypothetical protein